MFERPKPPFILSHQRHPIQRLPSLEHYARRVHSVTSPECDHRESEDVECDAGSTEHRRGATRA